MSKSAWGKQQQILHGDDCHKLYILTLNNYSISLTISQKGFEFKVWLYVHV